MENDRQIADLLHSPGWKALVEVLRRRQIDKANEMRTIARDSVTSAAFEWRGFS